MLKRVMYDRVGVDLLRIRVMQFRPDIDPTVLCERLWKSQQFAPEQLAPDQDPTGRIHRVDLKN